MSTTRRCLQKDARAHNSEIVAVCSALNSRDVISVAADGTVIWWSVEATPQCIRLLQCGAPITAATYDRESRLLAVALNTGDIKIYAAETARIARTFTSILSGGVTCTHLAISPHSTHLLVADSLAIIRASETNCFLTFSAQIDFCRCSIYAV